MSMFAVGSVAVGIIAQSVEAFLVAFGLAEVAVVFSVFLLESGGLLPCGSAPRDARRRMLVLTAIAAALALLSLVIVPASAADVAGIAAFACSTAGGYIAAYVLTR